MPRCRVMGILNATPDSFSDGGDVARDLEARLDAMARADIIDIGGESTRPGHTSVSAEEEIQRVLPVIHAAANRYPNTPISIDTSKASVARAALDAGASIVNDVRALADPEMGPLVAARGCGVVLMRHADLRDPVPDCRKELEALVARAHEAGVADDKILVDPGLGFGNLPGADPAANLALVRDQSYARHPVLIGASRKRFLGALTGIVDPKARVHASVGIAVLAAASGASIVRVHDVRETREALDAAGF